MIVYLFVVIQIYSSSAVFFYLIVKLSLEKSDEPKNYFFPIPEREMNINRQLKQNKGWYE